MRIMLSSFMALGLACLWGDPTANVDDLSRIRGGQRTEVPPVDPEKYNCIPWCTWGPGDSDPECTLHSCTRHLGKCHMTAMYEASFKCKSDENGILSSCETKPKTDYCRMYYENVCDPDDVECYEEIRGCGSASRCE